MTVERCPVKRCAGNLKTNFEGVYCCWKCGFVPVQPDHVPIVHTSRFENGEVLRRADGGLVVFNYDAVQCEHGVSVRSCELCG